MIARVLLLTFALLAIALVLLGIKVLFVKGGRFPSGHAHNLPGLQRKHHATNQNKEHELK